MMTTPPAATVDLPHATVEWARSPHPVSYPAALDAMEERATAIALRQSQELVWLLEHPPVVTAGTSARMSDLVDPHRFPVHRTGRGGQLTYHGPGQRVVYVMLDVRRRFSGDVRAFVSALETWTIEALAELGVAARTIAGRTGVWVDTPDAAPAGVAKIAAIGVRIARGVSRHGIAINVAPDLDHFRAIVPCGISDAGVTSLAALGHSSDMNALDMALQHAFVRRFHIGVQPARAPSGTEAPGSA